MFKKSKYIALILGSFLALNLSVAGFAATPGSAPVKTLPAPVKTDIATPQSYKTIDPVSLVNDPQSYLNNQVKISATFDKFTSLGLDYPPAKRDSKSYIAFLIKRPDVPAQYNIPLSELKILMKREKAEKFIDLESGDQIEVYGKVFSTALGDPWVEVDSIKVLKAKNPKLMEKLNKPDDKSVKPPAKK